MFKTRVYKLTLDSNELSSLTDCTNEKTNLPKMAMNQSYSPYGVIASRSDSLCQISIPDKYILVWHPSFLIGRDILLQTLHYRVSITKEEILGQINTGQKLFVSAVEVSNVKSFPGSIYKDQQILIAVIRWSQITLAQFSSELNQIELTRVEL